MTPGTMKAGARAPTTKPVEEHEREHRQEAVVAREEQPEARRFAARGREPDADEPGLEVRADDVRDRRGDADARPVSGRLDVDASLRRRRRVTREAICRMTKHDEVREDQHRPVLLEALEARAKSTSPTAHGCGAPDGVGPWTGGGAAWGGGVRVVRVVHGAGSANGEPVTRQPPAKISSSGGHVTSSSCAACRSTKRTSAPPFAARAVAGAGAARRTSVGKRKSPGAQRLARQPRRRRPAARARLHRRRADPGGACRAPRRPRARRGRAASACARCRRAARSRAARRAGPS